MTSHAPQSCCYQGVKHEGETVGRFENVDDFEVYISEAPDKSRDKAILILTDVIGHRFNNAKLIADAFAKNGYFVFMPDLFYGDPVELNRPGDFDFQKWFKGSFKDESKPHVPHIIDPIVERSIKELREKYGVKQIGAVGYCFGAKYVVRFLKSGKIDAGYSAHPSFVAKEELEAIENPFAISAAETDDIFPTEKRHESEQILKKTGKPYQINLYSGVVHGFAVRGEPNDKVATYAKESAFLQAVQWFEEHLK